jgi:hypothetical protein
MRKRLLTLSFLGLLVSQAQAVPLDASALRLKIYKFAVSSSPNCSNPVTVVDNGTTPDYVDFKDQPTLGSGSVANGTYPCVIIEFSDNIKVTPSATGAQCDSLVETTQDVCRDYNQDSDNDPTTNPTQATLIDGTVVSCDGTDNKVAMYITTAASASQETDAFNPPDCNTEGCTATTGLNLANAFVVNGSETGSFLVNTDGKVCDGNDGGAGDCAGEDNSTCNMLPPDFSFSQL